MRELAQCPICTSTDKILIYPSTLSNATYNRNIPDPYSAHYQINDCKKCELRFSSPIMEDHEVTALYCTSENGNIVEGEEINVKRTMYNYYRLIKFFVLRKDKVLDIGCDVGYLLNAALDDGFKEVYGLEPTTPARKIAEKLPNSILSEQFYEEVDYPPCSFDLITMIHVLDHLVDPSIALLKAKKELKANGIIFAVVHNSKSLLGISMGERFPVYNLYHHYFFNKRTLRALLESKGFEVINVVSTKNCYSLSFFIRKIPLLPNFFKTLLLKLTSFFKISQLSINIPIGNIGIIARKIS